jgi:hypothetical protein
VLDTSTDKDFEGFVGKLPERDCRWAVYDFEFNLGADGIRNKLAFIMWSVSILLFWRFQCDETDSRAGMCRQGRKESARRNSDSRVYAMDRARRGWNRSDCDHCVSAVHRGTNASSHLIRAASYGQDCFIDCRHPFSSSLHLPRVLKYLATVKC